MISTTLTSSITFREHYSLQLKKMIFELHISEDEKLSVVAHAYSPSKEGRWKWEDCGLEPSKARKLARPSLRNKLGVVMHFGCPSYAGGRDRRTQSEADTSKSMNFYLKNKLKQK
jgi:hypothetical protein